MSPSIERLVPKRVQILRDFLPKLKRVGILRSPVDTVLDKALAELEPALSPVGVTIVSADLADAARREPAVARLAGARVEAIVDSMTAPVTLYNRQRLIELANRARLPCVGTAGWAADAGALFSYGGSEAELSSALARIVDRVLRGASPAAIPVEAVNAFALVLNLKAARLPGIAIPQSALLRATRVIE